MLEEEEDDTIHMGNAVMTFYAALIDLLGRCAPEMHVSRTQANNDSDGQMEIMFFFFQFSVDLRRQRWSNTHQSYSSVSDTNRGPGWRHQHSILHA